VNGSLSKSFILPNLDASLWAWIRTGKWAKSKTDLHPITKRPTPIRLALHIVGKRDHKETELVSDSVVGVLRCLLLLERPLRLLKVSRSLLVVHIRERITNAVC
jgi:hypothetical protein